MDEISRPPIIDDGENYIIPSWMFQYLPPEMRALADATQEHVTSIVRSVEKEIDRLNVIGGALPTMVSLRYIQYRLQNTKFEATTESILEQDMLMSVFSVTYKRLVDGGSGTGISRKQIPPHLRPVHDFLIGVRNKRFAHNDHHPSISNGLEVTFIGNQFSVNLNQKMGIYIQGADEWEELVVFLDGLMHSRLHKQLEILKEKTGYEWIVPGGATPPWADDAAVEENSP
ncbi:MAG TPA: hypothetical protein VN038_21130 [Dyadobacter sp.]|nr:hypothetical protein [Dyadobacter sp.]